MTLQCPGHIGIDFTELAHISLGHDLPLEVGNFLRVLIRFAHHLQPLGADSSWEEFRSDLSEWPPLPGAMVVYFQAISQRNVTGLVSETFPKVDQFPALWARSIVERLGGAANRR